MTPVLVIAIVLGGIVSVIATLAFRPLLSRLQVIDVPNERSSHERPTLRGGGLGPTLGLLCGGITAIVYLGAEEVSAPLVGIIALGVGAAIVGMIEDVRGIPIVARAALQLSLGLLFALYLGTSLGLSWWWSAMAAVLIAGYINVANFMDGINGISGLHGLVVGLSFALMGYATDLAWLTTAGALVAVVFAAFLPWNLTRPGLFLGDVGSYLLGATVAGIAVAASAAGVSLILALSPLAIYIADAGWTLLRRVARGERWYEAHKTHTYQTLTQLGLSHVSVAMAVGGATILCVMAGWISTAFGAPVWGIAGILAITLSYLASPALLRNLSRKA